MTLDSLSMLLFQWPVHIWNFHLIQESKWCPRKFWNLSKKHHYQHQLLWFLWILPYFIGFFMKNWKTSNFMIFYDFLWVVAILLQHSGDLCTPSNTRILSSYYNTLATSVQHPMVTFYLTITEVTGVCICMGEMAWEIQEYGNHLSTVFIGQNMQLFFQPQGPPPMSMSPGVHGDGNLVNCNKIDILGNSPTRGTKFNERGNKLWAHAIYFAIET